MSKGFKILLVGQLGFLTGCIAGATSGGLGLLLAIAGGAAIGCAAVIVDRSTD